MRGRHLSLEKQRLKFFQKRFDIFSFRERQRVEEHICIYIYKCRLLFVGEIEGRIGETEKGARNE